MGAPNCPSFFESTIVTLLVNMGYGGSREDAERALGKSGDNGLDGVIDQDPLGLDRVYLEWPKYAAPASGQARSLGTGSV